MVMTAAFVGTTVPSSVPSYASQRAVSLRSGLCLGIEGVQAVPSTTPETRGGPPRPSAERRMSCALASRTSKFGYASSIVCIVCL